MIDEYKLCIPPQMKSASELGGMVGLAYASKLILLIATFRPHHRQVMRQVLNIKSKRVHEFKNTS